jgi:hypothetical protein
MFSSYGTRIFLHNIELKGHYEPLQFYPEIKELL